MSDEETPKSGAAKKIVRISLLIVVLAAFTLAIVFRKEISTEMQSFLGWVKSLGFWGPFIVVIAYIVATVLFLPGSFLTMGSGFLFDLFLGTAVVVVASNIGAALAFLIGRTIGRSWIEGKVRNNPKFQAIDRAVGEQGFKIVLLTRLSPVFPFNLLNYAYGLTRVKFWHYVAGNVVGMFLGTVMYVYFGTAVKNIAEIFSGDAGDSTLKYILLGIGLVVTIVLSWYITRIAKQAINKHVGETDDGKDVADPGAAAEGSAQSEA